MMFSEGNPSYVIAEIGANHNGDLSLARKMIDVAKECGADAVKFQSWDTTIFSKQVYDQNYFLGDDYRERSDYTLKEIVEEFALSFDDMVQLRDYCRSIDIDFASTPFNERQVSELVELEAPFIKVASMDITNPRLLDAAGKTGLPIVLSTGFSYLDEIDRAVRWIEATGNNSIVILHCVSLYPTDDEDVNLNNIDTLRAAFSYPVGFSDHTMGTEIPVAAIARGAVVIEKHFTLDREMFGWDHKMSCTPDELKAICHARDRIHAALGSPIRVVGERELAKRDEYRRSIVTARPLKAGAVLKRDDVDFRRPGTGLRPELIELLAGMRLKRDIGEDELLALDDIESAAGDT